MSDSAARIVENTVERLVRTHNSAVLIVFLSGIASVAYVQTTHAFADRPSYMWMLRLAAITLPIASVALAATTNHVLISHHARAAGPRLPGAPEADAPGPAVPAAAEISADQLVAVAGLYLRGERVAIALVTLAGVFGGGTLIFGHQTLDVLIAAVPFGLLLLRRPSIGGLRTTAQLVELARPAKTDDAR